MSMKLSQKKSKLKKRVYVGGKNLVLFNRSRQEKKYIGRNMTAISNGGGQKKLLKSKLYSKRKIKTLKERI